MSKKSYYPPKLSYKLYKLSRTMRMIEVISTGDLKKIGRYFKNRAIYRALYSFLRRLK